jgi:hypothetical protein
MEMVIATNRDLQHGFLVYGMGFATLNSILLMLNREALRMKDELGLDPLEVLETRRSIGAHALHAGIAVFSMVLALILRSREMSLLSALPGFAYALTGIAMWWYHSRFGRMRTRLGRG